MRDVHWCATLACRIKYASPALTMAITINSFPGAALILTLLLASPGFSQDDISAYLDEGKAGNKNLIKVNLVSSISGNVTVCYERKISKKWSLEAGVGWILPYSIEPLHLLEKTTWLTSREMGFSYFLQARNYPMSDALRGFFWSPQFAQSYFKGKQPDRPEIRQNWYTMNFGYQFELLGLFADISLGLGLRKSKINTEDIEQFNGNHGSAVVFPIGIKLGYLF